MKVTLPFALLAMLNLNCAAQEPAAEVQQPASSGSSQDQADSANQTLAVPVGNRVASPAGTYVDGEIEKVLKHGPTGHAGLQVHFMRMVFDNGYTVSLEGATAQARRRTEEDQDFPRAHSPQHSGFAASAFPQQQPPLPPPLPPLPKLGPSAGEVAGIGIGIAAATAIGFIVLNRHSADNF